MGVRALTLNGLSDERSLNVDASGGIPFVLEVATVAGTSTYRVWEKSCPRSCRVIDIYGFMTGAGAAGDTVVVSDGSNNISDTMDVSGNVDTARFTCAGLNDDYTDLAEGASLQVTTASDALVKLYIVCVWTD